MGKKDYTDVSLEDINGKFDLLVELIMPMSKAVKKLEDNMRDVKSDVKVIKKVVSDHSITLHSHEYRTARLESA